MFKLKMLQKQMPNIHREHHVAEQSPRKQELPGSIPCCTKQKYYKRVLDASLLSDLLLCLITLAEDRHQLSKVIYMKKNNLLHQ